MQARLGVPPAAPVPHPDDAVETMCVVCFGAPKNHLVLPQAPARERGVCGAADQYENADVSRVPRAHLETMKVEVFSGFPVFITIVSPPSPLRVTVRVVQGAAHVHAQLPPTWLNPIVCIRLSSALDFFSC